MGRPRKRDLQDVLDKLAGKLSHWKARLLSLEGRVAYVQVVMTASVVYHLLALDLDPWFFKAVDSLRRGFLWAQSSDAQRGCCRVAWRLVCQPKILGGLGIHNLQLLNYALRTKWIWLRKTDRSRSWSGLHLPTMPEVTALFNASVKISVGDGSRLLFWADPWINGLTASAIAPAVVSMVAPRFISRRSVRDGFVGNAWVTDISGELSVDAVVQFLELWAAVGSVPRTPDSEDAFR
jgi:hypothetical protein